MTLSDSSGTSLTYVSVSHLPSVSIPAVSCLDSRPRSPGFRTRDIHTCFGSSTPGNRHRTCDLTPCLVLLSRSFNTVSIPNLDFGAQYRAYAFPCQRLVAALTDSPTHDSEFRRLAMPFRAEDFHLQSLASLSRRTVSTISLKLLMQLRLKLRKRFLGHPPNTKRYLACRPWQRHSPG